MDDFDDDMTTLNEPELSRRSRTGRSGALPKPEPDSFDDDKTSLSHAVESDSFDDDETSLSNSPPYVDDLDDDETEIVSVSAVRSVRKPHTGGSPDRPSGARSVERRPLHSGLSSALAAERGSRSSLRDRVPEVGEPWQPPSRPRSPEYVAPMVIHKRPWRPVAGVLAASGLLVVAVWFFVIRSEAPLDDQPVAENIVEADVDDAG